MTSATDELRRLLDEHGVEYRWDNGVGTWCVGGVMYNAWGYDNERLTMSVCHLTPAQAIEAALGRGTCRVEYVWDMTDEYEYAPHVYYTIGLTCGHSFERGDSEPPSFCPECGRKVVK